jgi:hypothetical protein
MDQAIMDIGAVEFSKSAMSYVALSRVKRLENVHLIDFDPSNITCNRTALIEYNRLRTIYNANLVSFAKKFSLNLIFFLQVEKKQFFFLHSVNFFDFSRTTNICLCLKFLLQPRQIERLRFR